MKIRFKQAIIGGLTAVAIGFGVEPPGRRRRQVQDLSQHELHRQ